MQRCPQKVRLKKLIYGSQFIESMTYILSFFYLLIRIVYHKESSSNKESFQIKKSLLNKEKFNE